MGLEGSGCGLPWTVGAAITASRKRMCGRRMFAGAMLYCGPWMVVQMDAVFASPYTVEWAVIRDDGWKR